MYHQGIQGIPYYLGIRSLADIATPEDRVCVLNIMGGESRQVTPTSHAFSGGNVVFGTSPGRAGQVLKTPAGDIPVFNNVREGLDAGLSFNTGVVYLPPSGVRDGVAELVRVNPGLARSSSSPRRSPCTTPARSGRWRRRTASTSSAATALASPTRGTGCGSAGRSAATIPDESLIKGSVAIFSNSGGFTTTIAQYLGTAGWGTTTLVSSGKDLYIHYACPDFAHAFAADDRSKAAVLYAEPGGYYEHGIEWTKPVVACVVGRWKSKLTRAVGHAGAMAGSGDRAEDKERWFMQAFGVEGSFTPESPVVSARGAVVTNIADIPAALTAVMKLNGIEPDFAPRGNLALKPWVANDQGLRLPADIALPMVTAPEPYAARSRRSAGRSARWWRDRR